MRKLKVGSLVSLDGVSRDPQSWATDYFDELASVERRQGGVVSLSYGREA